jgi:hypothetical protein
MSRSDFTSTIWADCRPGSAVGRLNRGGAQIIDFLGTGVAVEKPGTPAQRE